MNCVLLHYVVSGDHYVPEGTPVRVVRMLNEGVSPPIGWVSDYFQDPLEYRLQLECVASFAILRDRLVRDVVVMVPPGGLKFMGVDPSDFRKEA